MSGFKGFKLGLAASKVNTRDKEDKGEVSKLLLQDEPEDEIVHVPQGSRRNFAAKPKSAVSGIGTLDPVARQRASDQAKEEQKRSQLLKALLSQLPPDTTNRTIEALFSKYPSLKINKIENFNPDVPDRPRSLRPRNTDRTCSTVIVTFDKTAEKSELDKAIKGLDTREYMGEGYWLTIDEYVQDGLVRPSNTGDAFDAKIFTQIDHERRNKQLGGYAPPEALGGHAVQAPQFRGERWLVNVSRPKDIHRLRLIHATAEKVVQGGEELEAALMQDPRTIHDPRFAFLWDNKHPEHLYYRSRIRQLLDEGPPDSFPMFRNSFVEAETASWELQEDPLPFEAATQITDLKADYDQQASQSMNPFARAQLVFLLSSLPTSTGQFTKAAAASVTKFANDYAGENHRAGDAMDEVIDLLVTNILRPFSLIERTDPTEAEVRDAAVISFWVATDVMLAHYPVETPTPWLYKRELGTQIVRRGALKHLANIPNTLAMGRLSAERYKSQIKGALELWKDSMLDEEIRKEIEALFFKDDREEDKDHQKEDLKEGRKENRKENRKEDHQDDGVENRKYEPDVGVAKHLPEDETHANITAPPQCSGKSLGGASVGTPGSNNTSSTNDATETAAARARRMRPKAEDLFGSDHE
ncbi:uncharacterized protein BDR25DRAFT_307067 [Lindgomyces ingoldianus]|uniref:Uncharacterized protein n=1 Tax=Lindgomyces ingoldianus TaxID=673940 RepID=A0ACB6QD06_9PLEO|nr:uncharacterized protein BDR25DRAFT_307067 [Lindgomyces ingoldianus]KAF2464745.1 hypothetical protein BDR25DRAFT_307067 [Lindgomyces ingoldianus]